MTGPVDAFHLQVARITLSVADRYGFVLGGGLALILHGIVSRPTEDIDRAEMRDFVDVAAFLADRSLIALLDLARTVDPGLFDEDVTAAGRRLDQTPDRAFAAYGLDAEQVAQLRARFGAWPR